MELGRGRKVNRLTKRDGKGRAYFDDDGALIRGANGTFHQKKDMTAQFIHQRFVALDKAIDLLAAYEDTGLTPEDMDTLRKREQGLAELLANISCGCAVTYTRLRELAQAEKDGRLAVAPCKEGDPVWWVDVDWTPGDGKMFYKIASGKFRYAMLDWQNPIYTSQAAAEAALAEMVKEGMSGEKSDSH